MFPKSKKIVLMVNTGRTDKEIVVDHLDLTNGHIHIIGDGKLTIYVTNKTTFGSGSTINRNGDVNKFNLFLKGSQGLLLRGSQEIYGSIYAEKGDIDLGAGAGVKGNLFSGGQSFKVSGGTWATSPLIFAPYAHFDHSNGTINGTLIAKSYSGTGGATLHQKDMDFIKGPISIEGINKENGNNNPTEWLIKKKQLLEKE
ncbi:DUF7305 domain-containing protein [Bacillus niameyensis]|uniref:DUF7305 domain-containing protein n=1 Tax=Bacillus niameyensis TaxID=1522308 RepID=UPI001E36D28B|nr:collagen-binding domain-containing protein [Bacillus niameyensis]